MKKVPCVMMRGGTSRGAFPLVEHLPEDQTQRNKILMAIMGSGNDLEIDGIGDGNPLTSKAVIISRSGDPCTDVSYLLAQVIVHEQRVDTTPNYDNMLSGAGAFAIKNGLIAATSPVIRIRIRSVNTGTFIEVDMQTPSDVVEYEGSTRIDGIPGTAIPVVLTFLNTIGTKTGKVFPTDSQTDYFDDVPVIYIDMAIPVVIIPAEYLGKTGYELPAELDAGKALLARIESIRLQADEAMGLGGINNMVIPKPMLTLPAQRSGAINARYLMPHSCHRALTITGTIAIPGNCILEGTVARQTVPFIEYSNVNIEHPSDALGVHLDNGGQDATTLRTSAIRTTKEILSGEVYLP